MKTKRHAFGVIGALLLAGGILGIVMASPEPVRMVQLENGSTTAVPRIPWATASAEVSLISGFGFLLASHIFKVK